MSWPKFGAYLDVLTLSIAVVAGFTDHVGPAIAFVALYLVNDALEKAGKA